MTGEIIVCSCVQTQCYVTHDFLYEGPEGTEADGLEAKILNYLHFIFFMYASDLFPLIEPHNL